MAAPKKKKVKKCIGRFVVMVIMSIPFIAMVLMLDFGDHLWYNMLRFAVPFFLWNLVLTFLLDKICLKCGLYDNQAEMKTRVSQTFEKVVLEMFPSHVSINSARD